MPDAQVRYCTTDDGVRIAYRVDGDGPALVVIPLFIESFSLDYMLPEHEAVMRRLSEGRRAIRYDVRGTGLSQRDVPQITHESLVKDLEAVVRAAGVKRLSVWASTTGGARAIDYCARHPRQVECLILYGTTARGGDVMPRESAEALITLSRTNWDVGAQVFADMAGRKEVPDFGVRYAAVYRESASGELAARVVEALYDSDVSALLPKVRARTLVIHRTHDNIYPFSCGQKLAAGIPNATFLPLEGHIHNVALLDSDSVTDAINNFMAPTAAPHAPANSLLRVVLFTDIVGHSEMMSRLGDESGRDVLREHERITREVLKQHGGAEVKTMGDGFMASFGSVTKAVECAIALQRAFAERNASASEPLHIRVGLNAGEPIEEEGPDGRSDLFGATVILAARIAARAEGGQILASLAVRELCAGKGFLFADTGEVTLKGFEEPVRLFAVREGARG